MQDNYVLHKKFIEEDVTEPVTLAEQKKYLRISADETYDDDLITQLIKTARQQLEGYLNISLVDKTVIARIQNETGYMHLPYIGDEITITGVIDSEGNTISSDNYKLQDDLFSGSGGTVGTPANNFYSPCNVDLQVTYDVSYPDGIRSEFKTAIMQQTAWLFERGRGDELASAISPIVKINLNPYRRVF